MNKINRIKELIKTLNVYRNEYYNNNNSLISDKEYDTLFDELTTLENETGFILSNSPTQSVGYSVQSKLNKIKHTHPMLSLDKTTEIDELLTFVNNNDTVLMLKDDGLTISLEYQDGNLVKAETRGNGEIGEDILLNAKQFENIPLHINRQGRYIIDGEAIITYDDFDKINNTMPIDKKYKNPRNLVSGSVRQLDSNITKQRHVKFLAWRVIELGDIEHINSHNDRLLDAYNLGFETTDYIYFKKGQTSKEELEFYIEKLKTFATQDGIPIDGLVAVIDDIKYGNSLGMTGHHPRHSIAFKFYQERNLTILREVEWNTTRTGLINPVAIFDTIEIDGTDVERASLHNLNIIEELQLGIGDEIEVIKANQIIPQVTGNNTRSNTLEYPRTCPCCNAPTIVVQTDNSKVLKCPNEKCSAKILDSFVNFVSKKAMNIDGLSEATLKKLIDLGIIKTFVDIFYLDNYENDIVTLEGFGKKSYDKLITSINNSRKVSPCNFLTALGIEGVSLQTAKLITNKYNIDSMLETLVFSDYTSIDGIGDVTASSIEKYFIDNYGIIRDLLNEVELIYEDETTKGTQLQDKVFVVTGDVHIFKNRKELQSKIESLGGKVTGSVSKKTDYLINNDIESSSSKNKKAKELNIPILTEEDFMALIG